MAKKSGIVMLLLLLAAAPAFARERKGTVTVAVALKAPAEANEVRLWLPYPMSERNQEVTGVRVSGNYTSSGDYREKDAGNAALYAEWKGPMAERKLTYSFAVTRKEMITRDFPKVEGPMPAEMIPYLSLNHLGKAETRIKELAADITKGKTTIQARARAVYDWIVDNMRRDPNVKGCGLCEIEQLLTDKAGKCADIHSVFVALARASGVPAREIYGIRMHKDKEGDITKFQHCWAEFYVPGYGWVAADPADVLKFKLEKNPTSEELAAKREYFFGAVDENRIAIGTGRDIVLNPRQTGRPLLYFMYPYAEADGKPLGEDLFGFNMGYTITFKEL